jgi:soluble lytic murein transglycosylase-like protein
MALSALAGLLVAAPSWACWDEAAARYGLSSHLLYAIARTESGLNPAAVGRNRDGSRDIGLMQINSSWLPTLAGHGTAASSARRAASNDPPERLASATPPGQARGLHAQ